MEELARLKKLIASMDIDALQMEADKLNKPMSIGIDKLSLYFAKAKGRRLGDYFSELKRMIAIELFSKGLINNEVSRILHVDHSTTIYYARVMTPNKKIAEEVKENFRHWINSGLYPKSVNMRDADNNKFTYYGLVDDPRAYIRTYVKKEKNTIEDLRI